MMNGQAIQPAANSAPASAGLAAEARPRGTDVTLAAAARSRGVTTAITNRPPTLDDVYLQLTGESLAA